MRLTVLLLSAQLPMLVAFLQSYFRLSWNMHVDTRERGRDYREIIERNTTLVWKSSISHKTTSYNLWLAWYPRSTEKSESRYRYKNRNQKIFLALTLIFDATFLVVHYMWEQISYLAGGLAINRFFCWSPNFCLMCPSFYYSDCIKWRPLQAVQSKGNLLPVIFSKVDSSSP